MPALATSTASLPRITPGTSSGPVLVACDGTVATADALFGAARLVAAAHGVAVEVLGVCPPTPGLVAGMDVLPIPAAVEESRRAMLLEAVQHAVAVSAGADAAWPITVLVGSPARVLAQEAERRGASLLVMGLGRHNPLDRLFGSETTLATLREIRVPVLAVDPDFRAPTHAVVGIDFSASSLQAAHVVQRLLCSGGTLTLVHVRPRFEHPSAAWRVWDAEYGRTLPPLLAQLREQLDAPGVVIETMTVRGDPAPALLACARQLNAELVAVGSQRHGLLERLTVGSVATRILRTARCSVLVVPGP